MTLFEQVLYEADGDPPDIPANTPPDMGEPADEPDTMDIGDESDAPPDDMGGGGPPELDDAFADDEGGFDEPMDEENPDETEQLGLDDKISSIMNLNIYQDFLKLLTTIDNQINNIKNNFEVLQLINNESINILEELKNLDTNIRIYLNEYFQNENSSTNLLFFNKCTNLLKMLTDLFSKNISSGIKKAAK